MVGVGYLVIFEVVVVVILCLVDYDVCCGIVECGC